MSPCNARKYELFFLEKLVNRGSPVTGQKLADTHFPGRIVSQARNNLVCSLVSSSWLFDWLTLRPGIWRERITPKLPSVSIRLHGVISRRVALKP
jgi:hypothetical protein